MDFEHLTPREINGYFTALTLGMSPHLLDEISYTIQFAKTAVALNAESESFRADLFRDRYGQNQVLLQADMEAAPRIVERLEAWAQRLPEQSQTRNFASKHLPAVRNFHEFLLAYERTTAGADERREIAGKR